MGFSSGISPLAYPPGIPPGHRSLREKIWLSPFSCNELQTATFARDVATNGKICAIIDMDLWDRPSQPRGRPRRGCQRPAPTAARNLRQQKSPWPPHSLRFGTPQPLAPAEPGGGRAALATHRRDQQRCGLLHGRGLDKIRLRCSDTIGKDRMRGCKNTGKCNCRKDQAEHVNFPVLATRPAKSMDPT